MPKVKKLHSPEGTRRRAKKLNTEQSAQIASSGLNLLQALSGCQDAELLSRIECHERLAQKVDEYYEYTLLVGEGKRVQKRCAEYIGIQHDISENLCEDIEELMRRMRLRKDILLLTEMTIAATKRRARVGEPANGDSQDPTNYSTLKLLCASMADKAITYKMPHPELNIPGVPDEEKQASPRQQIKKTMLEIQADSGKKVS
jgi:hypothetical protein